MRGRNFFIKRRNIVIEFALSVALQYRQETQEMRILRRKVMNKKLVALVGSVVMLGGVVAGAASCGKRDKSEFTVAYLAGGRGESYVEKLVEGFEKTDYVKQYMKDKGIEKLNAKIIKGPSASVEDTLRTEINSGTTPDVLFMNFNMPKTTTESFVRAKQVLDISDLLTQKVYGRGKDPSGEACPRAFGKLHHQALRRRQGLYPSRVLFPDGAVVRRLPFQRERHRRQV